jgi:hypothetical protein
MYNPHHMGFLERMEQEKERQRIENENRSKKASEESDSSWQKEKQEKERLLRLKTESKSKFDQTGIDKLVERLRRIDHNVGELTVYDFRNSKIDDSEDGKYRCWVEIRDTGEVETFFGIVIDHEGEVNFKGSLLGNSRIGQEQWKSDKSVLEEALGKAYRHPQKIKRPSSAGNIRTMPY